MLIPFPGSGSECLACRNPNLPFIALELNPDYIELIKARLDFGVAKPNDKTDVAVPQDDNGDEPQ